jgi:hypothetical protein
MSAMGLYYINLLGLARTVYIYTVLYCVSGHFPVKNTEHTPYTYLYI